MLWQWLFVIVCDLATVLSNNIESLKMVAYIQGKLTKKSPTTIVVETNGVGFQIWIPLSSYRAIGELGCKIKILTHLHVREDILQLFGFATSEEKDLFQLLIMVSGVGPRLALTILSGISVDDFKRAVQDENPILLTNISGVGKKTAERLVLELREKIGERRIGQEGIPSAGISKVGEEAIMALISLGYKKGEAQEIIRKILTKGDSLDVEGILRRALQKL